jgi:hypothetical protein
MQSHGDGNRAYLGADELGTVYRFRARIRRPRFGGGCRGQDFVMIDNAPWIIPPYFPPFRVVGRRRKARRLGGAWRIGGASRTSHHAAAPARSSRDTLSQTRRAEVSRPQGGTRRVGGRSGDFGSGDPVGERGASAELAARRVDDAGGDQPCGYPEDHRPYDLRPDGRAWCDRQSSIRKC